MNRRRPPRIFNAAWSLAFCVGGIMIGQGLPAAKWYINAGMVVLFLAAIVYVSWQKR
jgi:hypothetical protein